MSTFPILNYSLEIIRDFIQIVTNSYLKVINGALRLTSHFSSESDELDVTPSSFVDSLAARNSFLPPAREELIAFTCVLSPWEFLMSTASSLGPPLQFKATRGDLLPHSLGSGSPPLRARCIWWCIRLLLGELWGVVLRSIAGESGHLDSSCCRKAGGEGSFGAKVPTGEFLSMNRWIGEHGWANCRFGLVCSRSRMLPLCSSGWELRLLDSANSMFSSVFLISSTRLFARPLCSLRDGDGMHSDDGFWCFCMLTRMFSASKMSSRYLRSASLSASISAISDANVVMYVLPATWRRTMLPFT